MNITFKTKSFTAEDLRKIADKMDETQKYHTGEGYCVMNVHLNNREWQLNIEQPCVYRECFSTFHKDIRGEYKKCDTDSSADRELELRIEYLEQELRAMEERKNKYQKTINEQRFAIRELKDKIQKHEDAWETLREMIGK